MSSIYDNKANVAHLDGGSYKSSIAHNDEQIQQPVQKCEIFNDDNPDVADTVQQKMHLQLSSQRWKNIKNVQTMRLSLLTILF